MLKNYEIDNNGVIYQKTKKKLIYDKKYIQKYNNLGVIEDYMSHLRLGYIIGSIGKKPDSILDVGYGNGNFLKKCKNINRFGFDVSGYKIPNDCQFVNSIFDVEVEVTTFFDSLEHFENPYIIKNLKTTYIIISLPECHYFSDSWFENWKHRRPNEHLWHFNKNSLVNFMNHIGYNCLNLSNIEDIIRAHEYSYSNILTGCFKKK